LFGGSVSQFRDVSVFDTYRVREELIYQDLRYIIVVAQDVKRMKKRRKVDLLSVKVAERMKLAWKMRRQVQQEILQKKLMQCFLKPRKGYAYVQRYPEAMQPMIEDFMRKAEEQKKLYCM
jgi:hypothetical protein